MQDVPAPLDYARLVRVAQWHDYEERVAAYFRSLGHSATVHQTVRGARAAHQVDVWVTFLQDGVEQRWAVECKRTKERVKKHHVLTLRGVVEDVGASRGFLLSESGFQAGAYAAADSTSLTLTSLVDLIVGSRFNPIRRPPYRDLLEISTRLNLAARLGGARVGLEDDDARDLHNAIWDGVARANVELEARYRAGYPLRVADASSQRLGATCETVTVVLTPEVELRSGWGQLHPGDDHGFVWYAVDTGLLPLLAALELWQGQVASLEAFVIPTACRNTTDSYPDGVSTETIDARWLFDAAAG